MSRRGTILFVAPSAYTLGGLATWLDYLLPGLSKRGWNATLGLVSGPRHHRPQSYLELHPWPETMFIHNATGTPSGRLSAVRRAIRAIQPDLVVTVNIPDALLAAAQERDAGRDVRAVMTCHGIQPDLFHDMAQLNGVIDAVVCTNRLAIALAERIGKLVPEQVLYAPYGTSLSTPRPRPLPGDRRTLTIGYSGRLEQPQKRVHDLPAIADCVRSSIGPVRFLIAGSGPEEASLRQEISRRGLADVFEFLGHVRSEEMADRLYRPSDILLVTSSWETGPIVIWEALANGTAVVASRYVGSGREAALEHGRNCLMFDVGDAAAAAQEIVRLANDAHLYENIVTQGFETVRSRYSQEASVDQWQDVLTGLSSRAPRRETAGTRPPAASGRLDRWLGAGAAERIREVFCRRGPDNGAGGEWPHTISGAAYDQSEFWTFAAELDAPDRASVT